MKPLIEWKKGLFDRREFVVYDQSLDKDPILDPLLGMLTVAYMDVDTRKKWPKYMKLSRKGRSQKMREAQVPVLALMNRGQISTSNILSWAERYIAENGRVSPQEPILK